MVRTDDTDTVTARIDVIDVDTHVIEPTDLWTSRLPSKWRDRAPRTVFSEDWGCDCWIVGDQLLNPVGYYASAGWREPTPSYPPNLDEADPAGFDSTARLARMDEYGLYAQVLYPNIIGFEPQTFLALGPELALACVKAYNDFITDFAAADPNRLLPITVLPFWDVDEAIAEMKRGRDLGHRGALWAAKFHAIGFPRINSPHWDPVYAVAQDLDISLNLHVGIGSQTFEEQRFSELNRDNFKLTAHIVDTATSFLSNANTIGTLVVSDVFERFPQLQIVSVESGFGYLPFLLEALDWQWKNSQGPLRGPDRPLPSEKFFGNVYGSFWFEQGTLSTLGDHPEFADRLMFETDFPHPTSLSPGPASAAKNPKTMIEEGFAGVPADLTRKVLRDTAARLYHVA